MHTIENEHPQKKTSKKKTVSALRKRLLQPFKEHEFREAALLAYRNSTPQVRKAALLAFRDSKRVNHPRCHSADKLHSAVFVYVASTLQEN